MLQCSNKHENLETGALCLMKKHLPSAIILSALLLVLCLYSVSVENDANGPNSGTTEPVYAAAPVASLSSTQSADYAETEHDSAPMASLEVIRTRFSDTQVIVNGVPLNDQAIRRQIDGVSYVAAVPVLEAAMPSADVTVENGTLRVTSPDLNLVAIEGDYFFQANGRYLYAPAGVLSDQGTLLLPAKSLAQAIGHSLWDISKDRAISFQTSGSPIAAVDYPYEDLYWLSRAIYAEAGNQPMKGRIAVGTVILNRVANDQFPNTVKEVVFTPNQFSPVDNGTIYRTPDLISTVAAMLCLDGVKEADDCLYFNVTNMISWADGNREYVCTIGDHKFYL